MEKLIISNTPHVRAASSTKRIMIDVLIALAPTSVMGIVYFGWRAAVIIVLSTLSAFLSEVVFRLIRKDGFKTILKEFDFTSLVTGLLLALNLGSQVKWYVPILGSVFAIIVVKMLFGGTGKNFVNPAIAGRVFLLISFAASMASGWLAPSISAIKPISVDAGATVLGGVLKGNFGASNLDLFLGTGISGSLGETCKAALILGGIYLCIRRVIDFKYPLIYIVVTGLTACLFAKDINAFLPSILSGGLILGAIFMATDYVTTPNTTLGNIIYFVALGLLTAVLRHLKGNEVISYCILLMNFFVPLIDRYIIPKPFGYKKQKESEAKNG